MKRRDQRPKLLAFLCGVSMTGIAGLAGAAAPYYVTTQVLVPDDQWELGGTPPQLTPAPLYKPHDARTTELPDWWATSNERTGCAGITTFKSGSNEPLKNVIIDEPDVAYPPDETTDLPPCVGTALPEPPEPPVEPPEGTEPGPEDQFPVDARFSPSLCLPIVLPPGQTEVPYDVIVDDQGTHATGTVRNAEPDDLGRTRVCAPLGAEMHARHPHGPTIYWDGKKLYQVIEHSGLRWNADRSAFQIANTTDEESGFTLEWDVSNPKDPRVLNGYLNGHGAHEITVNQNNGLVFQGNHEDSPGVYPPNWVDVINTGAANPYGFIDVGYFNAVQGLDVDEETNEVRGAAHVGEKVFAFDGSCEPTPNNGAAVPPPAPPGYALPADSAMSMGWNCIKWWADIRPAFVAAFPDLATIFDPDPAAPDALPLVLHQHNLAMDDRSNRSYSTIHSIHDAEHTGLSDEEPPPSVAEEEGEEHFMGRWIAEVQTPTAIDATKKATVPVHMIDLSHGFGVLDFPSVEEVTGGGGVSTTGGLRRLQNSFVHAHFIWVDQDAGAKTLLVTGEHTGNLGVVRIDTRQLVEVDPISIPIKGCRPPPPEPGAAAEQEEPHVHGVVIQPGTGTAYVSDEGEHCFYESVTVLRRNVPPSQR